MTPSRTFLLVNAAVGVVVLGSVLAVARSWMPDQTPMCSERYLHGVAFAVEKAPGALLSGADLQSRLGVDEWGVLDNVSTVGVANGPARNALKVKLAATKAAVSSSDAGERYGMGFLWAPRSFGTSTAACLSSSVRVPEGFEFGRGGRLPALTAASSDATALSATDAWSRLQWRENGVGEVVAKSGRALEVIAPDAFRLTPGRWVRLEHEVVLNSPNAADGIVRLWVDGTLKVERKGLVLRDSADQTITGIAAEVAYGLTQPAKAPPPNLELLITPFELRRPQ
jgi:hypothetical protein